MTERRIGWAFVVVQIVLLVVLIVVPDNDHWPTSGMIDLISTLLVGLGLIVMVVAAVRLGPALTPTPVPNDSGRLTTHGLYRYCRHPIYSGILLIVVGLVVGSGSLWTAGIGISTVVFFNVKAAWEETRLLRYFPEYSTYAAATPRFVPRITANRARPTPR